jgi:hypothetical protein
MLLYNVTLIIEEAAENEWLQWMKEIHIPEVLATEKFVSNRLLKVLDSPNEGVTYFAPALQAKLQIKFENRFVAFRTLMEFVG